MQRLIAFAVSEHLVRFRMDHPIAACVALGNRLCDRFGLVFCDVVPGVREVPDWVRGVAVATAERLERVLSATDPVTLCVGTGRTLRLAVEELDTLDRPQHRIVSLVGSMAADGHASPYDVVMRLADRLGAARYPMPAPVVTETAAERRMFQSQRAYTILRRLRDEAQASFVGIGQIGPDAPLHREGFASEAEIRALLAEGAAGEITGWVFDRSGRVMDCPFNTRLTSLPLEVPPARLTVVAAAGPAKVGPLRAALRGGLLSALVTDEETARQLLEDPRD